MAIDKPRASKGKGRGILFPVVDFTQCEAKGPCVDVCPCDVFEIGPIRPQDHAVLPLLGKVKNWVHGGKVAHVAHPESCEACGLCVQACPEKAIRLQAIKL